MRASTRHSIRKLFAVGTAIVALGVFAPLASAGSQKPFHLEKVCDTGTHCVVTASNFAAIPAGSEINYTGPDPDHLVPVLTIKNGTPQASARSGAFSATHRLLELVCWRQEPGG